VSPSRIERYALRGGTKSSKRERESGAGHRKVSREIGGRTSTNLGKGEPENPGNAIEGQVGELPKWMEGQKSDAGPQIVVVFTAAPQRNDVSIWLGKDENPEP